MHLQENTLFDLLVKVTQNLAQYFLHHVTYAPAKFKVATANSLGGDTISKNVTDGLMDRQIEIHTDGHFCWVLQC